LVVLSALIVFLSPRITPSRNISVFIADGYFHHLGTTAFPRSASVKSHLPELRLPGRRLKIDTEKSQRPISGSGLIGGMGAVSSPGDSKVIVAGTADPTSSISAAIGPDF
jgi:hypothetical protein